MLKQIVYTFPASMSDSQSFLRLLTELLSELPNAQTQNNDSLTITPSKPADALPITIFAQSDVPFPQLNLDSSQELSLSVGNLHINPDRALDYEIDKRGFDQILAKQDSLGEYFEL